MPPQTLSFEPVERRDESDGQIAPEKRWPIGAVLLFAAVASLPIWALIIYLLL